MLKKMGISFYIFIILILEVFSILPVWNLINTAIDLLPNKNTEEFHEYTIETKEMYSLTAILKKKISRKNDLSVQHKNSLILNNVDKGTVNFEYFESYYTWSDNQILCPKGNYNPFKVSGNDYIEITYNNNWIKSDRTDLKCYLHRSGSQHLLVYYLMNEDNYFLEFSGASLIENTNLRFNFDEILDFKLKNKESYEGEYLDSAYAFMALVKLDDYIKLIGTKIYFNANSQSFDSPKDLIEAKKYSQGYFNAVYENNDFYYFTYNDISDFCSGYSTSTVTTPNYDTINNVNVINNLISPFEFLDEVEIKQMDSMLYNQYVYYTILNKKTNVTYHGILDIKANKVIFNTDEELEVFIPYIEYRNYNPYSISMLAINKESAYRVCVIKDGNSETCLESCSGKIIYDTDGTKCVSSTDSCETFNKMTMIPEEICISVSQCNSSIYTSNSTHCGLCKDMNSTHQYKLINGTNCLSEIPTGSKLYNFNHSLLICENGYILDNDNDMCIPHCYDTCETCSDFSTNTNDQKCLSCKEGYYLKNDFNCELILPTTIITTILLQIPTTLINKIPSTIISPAITTTIVLIPPSTTPMTTITLFPTTTITTIPIQEITSIPKPIKTSSLTTTIESPPVILTTVPKLEDFECNDKNKEKCLKCSRESNEHDLCLICKNGYQKVNYTILYQSFVDCIKIDNPILKKYYYDKSKQYYRPCFKTCKKCLIGGNEEANNCLECETGYMFHPGNNPKNNCVAYSEYYYLSNYNQYKGLKIYQCPEMAKYKIKEKKACIDDCTKDNEYKFLYNGNCLKECPSNTKTFNYICTTEPEICSFGEDNDLHLYNNDLSVIEILAKSYTNEFSYTNKFISLYKNDNYSIMIYKDASCIKELSLEMPNINFESCYNKVKEAYNINDNLLVSVAENKILDNPITFFSFFHPISGEKLDAENLCKEDTIIIEENLYELLNKNKKFYSTQTSLTNQGINIFDKNHPFFKDLCYDYENNLKKDIPLSRRIKDIYPNVSLCDEGCLYESINLENMTAKCDCKFNDINNNNIIKDNEVLNILFDETLDLINESNILVLKCIKYMFKHFSRSIGGWISLIIIIILIIMVILYFSIDLNKIRIFIMGFNENFFEYILKEKNLEKNIVVNIDKYTPPKRTHGIINKENEKKYKKKINNKMIESMKDSNKTIGSKAKILIHKKSIIEVTEKNDLNIEFFKKYFQKSFYDMEYDEALVYDKRHFLTIFCECLREKQIIANTFIAKDDLKPRSIKIIVFSLNFILYFVINGLFFSEKVIEQLYELDKSKEHFFSYFTRLIDRMFYCTLIGVVIGYIEDFIFVGIKKFKSIYLREKDNIAIIKQNIIDLLTEINKRNFAFIIFVSIIFIFSFIYLCCFNYVYPYSQIEWIKSSITILIIMQILSLLKCLLISSLRILSFKINSEKLYKISKVFI